MPGILIIAHAPLASALKSVAQHTFPDCARALEALDVTLEMGLEEIEVAARALLERVRSPHALVLTDVLSATPGNVAQKLVDGPNVRLLAGVNVPMLWCALGKAHGSLEDMAGCAADRARLGVVQVAASPPQNQPPKRRTHDPENDQDQ